MDPIITQALDFIIEDLFRGDSTELTLTVTLGGTATDLTGATVFFTAKAAITDADNVALMSYDSTAGTDIVVAAPATGIAVITLRAADTALAPVDTPVFADVQVKLANGKISTVAFGQLVFRSDVTQRTS